MDCPRCGVEMVCEGVRERDDGGLVIDYWCMKCGREIEKEL